MALPCFIQAGVLLQVSGITSGRAATLLPALLGLISIIIGWMVLARSAKRKGYLRSGAITALIIGSVDVVMAALHVVRSSGQSFGSGSGRLGAIVALVLGLTGIVLSGLALVRSGKNVPGGGQKS